MKHKWRKTSGRHTETVSSAGPGRPESSQHIPSLHMCKQTAGREHKQQLEPTPHKPELSGHQGNTETTYTWSWIDWAELNENEGGVQHKPHRPLTWTEETLSNVVEGSCAPDENKERRKYESTCKYVFSLSSLVPFWTSKSLFDKTF